jgi:hypothetical protein
LGDFVSHWHLLIKRLAIFWGFLGLGGGILRLSGEIRLWGEYLGGILCAARSLLLKRLISWFRAGGYFGGGFKTKSTE